MDKPKDPRKVPYVELEASAIARELAWYIAHPGVVCSKGAGLGLKN